MIAQGGAPAERSSRVRNPGSRTTSHAFRKRRRRGPKWRSVDESIATNADPRRSSGHPFGVLGPLIGRLPRVPRMIAGAPHSLHPGLSSGRAVGTGAQPRHDLGRIWDGAFGVGGGFANLSRSRPHVEHRERVTPREIVVPTGRPDDSPGWSTRGAQLAGAQPWVADNTTRVPKTPNAWSESNGRFNTKQHLV